MGPEAGQIWTWVSMLEGNLLLKPKKPNPSLTVLRLVFWPLLKLMGSWALTPSRAVRSIPGQLWQLEGS